MGFVRVFATIIVAFSALFAAGENPSTLGLEVGKSTIADAKAKYSLKSTGINRYSEGEQFEIDVSGVKLDGATKAFIIFDKNGKLAAIVIEFSGNKFDSLYKSLNGQYKARRKILREDNKFARFSIVNGEVRLIEPRDSFTTTLIYATTQMWEKAESSVLQK